MRLLRSLLVVLALAGAACNDGDARQANAPTTRTATVSTTTTVAGSSATSRVAAAGDGCPPSTDAAVAEAATLTLGPSAGVPPTEASGVPIVITGTVVDAVIKGTNFAEGMAVGFENGSGSAPVVSNVTVLDSSTITLTVTVKQVKNATDRVWDLRVGSAVLPNAFEVLK